MPHDACFVWDKVLARNWGVQDGLVGRLQLFRASTKSYHPIGTSAGMIGISHLKLINSGVFGSDIHLPEYIQLCVRPSNPQCA
jgi:hypothetical protein